jgi:hypothetical protein
MPRPREYGASSTSAAHRSTATPWSRSTARSGSMNRSPGSTRHLRRDQARRRTTRRKMPHPGRRAAHRPMLPRTAAHTGHPPAAPRRRPRRRRNSNPPGTQPPHGGRNLQHLRPPPLHPGRLSDPLPPRCASHRQTRPSRRRDLHRPRLATAVQLGPGSTTPTPPHTHSATGQPTVPSTCSPPHPDERRRPRQAPARTTAAGTPSTRSGTSSHHGPHDAWPWPDRLDVSLALRQAGFEVPIRHGRHDVVPGVVMRGHRALDELNALR